MKSTKPKPLVNQVNGASKGVISSAARDKVSPQEFWKIVRHIFGKGD